MVQTLQGVGKQVLPGLMLFRFGYETTDRLSFVPTVQSVMDILLAAPSSLESLVDSLPEFVARGNRVGELVSQLRAVAEEGNESLGKVSVSDSVLELEKVDVVSPASFVLIQQVSFVLGAGKCRSVLVMGRPGCGKSSVCRVLAGLWPFPCGGRVVRPRSIVFLPQQPYLISGSLRANVMYPDAACTDDERIARALTLARVGEFVRRFGGLDSEHDFVSELSLGEQQRLSFSRLFYHAPAFAVLDESTSALDEENQAALYAALREHTSSCFLSVGHRLELVQHHERVLVVNPETRGWELRGKE